MNSAMSEEEALARALALLEYSDADAIVTGWLEEALDKPRGKYPAWMFCLSGARKTLTALREQGWELRKVKP